MPNNNKELVKEQILANVIEMPTSSIIRELDGESKSDPHLSHSKITYVLLTDQIDKHKY